MLKHGRMAAWPRKLAPGDLRSQAPRRSHSATATRRMHGAASSTDRRRLRSRASTTGGPDSRSSVHAQLAGAAGAASAVPDALQVEPIP